MTLAWYGHLQFKQNTLLQNLGLFSVILVSWGLAFFEYLFQVPANKIGHESNGGPFSLFQLKIIQEAVSLTVFSAFAVLVFKTDKLSVNYMISFFFILLAVYFAFKD